MEQPVEIVEADLARADHQKDVLALTNAYALDPMGGGGPLSQETLDRLVPALRETPATLILLAYVDGNAVGIATCFQGFSTFAARPLLNVHDLAVLPEHRGRGVGRALLTAVEHAARVRGCCKITLEVLEKNPARRLYEDAGFGPTVDPGSGTLLFYSKTLA